MPRECIATELGSTGLSWQAESSPVLLTRVYSYWSSDYDVTTHGPGPIYFNDCAEFTNQSQKPISELQVVFALADSQRQSLGDAKPLNIRENVAPGQSLTGLHCRTHAYANGSGGRWLVGWTNAVTFADGTTWHAVPPVAGTAIESRTSGIGLASVTTILPLQECVAFTNESARTATHAQFIFRHLGLDGSVLGDDALDVRANVARAAALQDNCRGFDGTSDPGLLYYGYALSHGATNVKPPVIFYRGRPSRLSPYVNEVDFADGMSWHAPST